ncbi:hypothetical protein B0I35DRAFT_481193 [Stachybotrys elegans]|uniref:Uncharacterized protein n=1 Tax=Stachybotrys elegans TaxID=80388 RepID=A0A8K0WNB0_9HYPO|nr:hypothetical protein B0I35DRAFT_481193 [Stachybotrys elegans]
MASRSRRSPDPFDSDDLPVDLTDRPARPQVAERVPQPAPMISARRSTRLNEEPSALVPRPKERAPYGSFIPKPPPTRPNPEPVPDFRAPKRPRGRPPKSLVEDSERLVDERPAKRPRGRPRKVPLEAEPQPDAFEGDDEAGEVDEGEVDEGEVDEGDVDEGEVTLFTAGPREFARVREVRRGKVSELRETVIDLLESSLDIPIPAVQRHHSLAQAFHICLETTGRTPFELVAPAMSLGAASQPLDQPRLKRLVHIVVHHIWVQGADLIPWIIAIAFAMRVGHRGPVTPLLASMHDPRFARLDAQLRDNTSRTVQSVISSFFRLEDVSDSPILTALSELHLYVSDNQSLNLETDDFEAIIKMLDFIEDSRIQFFLGPQCRQMVEFYMQTMPSQLCLSVEEVPRVYAADRLFLRDYVESLDPNFDDDLYLPETPEQTSQETYGDLTIPGEPTGPEMEASAEPGLPTIPGEPSPPTEVAQPARPTIPGELSPPTEVADIPGEPTGPETSAEPGLPTIPGEGQPTPGRLEMETSSSEEISPASPVESEDSGPSTRSKSLPMDERSSLSSERPINESMLPSTPTRQSDWDERPINESLLPSTPTRHSGRDEVDGALPEGDIPEAQGEEEVTDFDDESDPFGEKTPCTSIGL